MRRFSTEELTNGIIRTKDLQRYFRSHENSLDEISFSKYLDELLTAKGMMRADVIRRANLDRSFGFQIFNGLKHPSRDKVIQLAIGFEMDYQEATALLRAAGKAPLYARLKREAILIYAISHHMSVYETQYMLTEAGLTPLGGGGQE